MAHRLKSASFLPLVLISLSACGAESSRAGAGVIEGHVTLGPIMPVCRQGVPCDGVYGGAKIVVRDKAGEVVATAIADRNGDFKVGVRVGAFVVGVDVAGQMPSCTQVEVVVADGATVRSQIDCDSGIR
jgi:hypothetical protein